MTLFFKKIAPAPQDANPEKATAPELVSLLKDVTERYKPERTTGLSVVPLYPAEHRGIPYQVEGVTHHYSISKVVEGQGVEEMEKRSWFEAVILGYPITEAQLQRPEVHGVPAYLFPGWIALPEQSVPVRLVKVADHYCWVRVKDTVEELEEDVKQTIDFLLTPRANN